ncbi:hypothetical protein DH2020_048546 [Rehmannia glutinosa]|uniref:SIAH-type domain-containing protein n=1 Tax=Rehmannia glutinosa TaxID=99300 RepID=A0ABR0U5F5_REHGL
MAAIEMESVECVSLSDGIEDEEMQSSVSSHPHQYSSKPHGVVSSGIGPTSVHELLECPVAESLELPCKYYSLGCSEIFPYYSKLKHEAVCNFRPYGCPYAGSECAVTGDIPYLVTHLRDDHKVDMHTDVLSITDHVKSNPREVEKHNVDVNGEFKTCSRVVFHCFGQYFCLHFEAFQLGMAPVYMAFLRFMGDENEARNYSYSLEVGGNGRKLIWEGTPRSIRDSHRKVRDSHDGLIIQRNMALFFSGGDRKELKLRVTGRIWKEQQNPDAGVCIPNKNRVSLTRRHEGEFPRLDVFVRWRREGTTAIDGVIEKFSIRAPRKPN